MPDAGLLGKIQLEHTTTSTAWEDLVTIPISANTSVNVLVKVVTQESNLVGRASFERQGLFYRKVAASQTGRPWHTIFTERTDPGFDIRYVLQPTGVTLQVKSPNTLPTLWRGFMEIQPVY